MFYLANIANGKIYSWDSSIAAKFTTRASTTTPDYLTSSAPTANRSMMMSPVTRHLVLFGTETTIGVTTSQDDMFIRFSDQETINTFAPTAINTAQVVNDFKMAPRLWEPLKQKIIF